MPDRTEPPAAPAAPPTTAEPTVPTAGEEILLPFTVRRAAPKLGRNEPCHCGSGRKYKKCCMDKDRERLADPSPWAGLTMEEAKRDPSRHGDPSVFFEHTDEQLETADLAGLSVPLVTGYLDVCVERKRLRAARRGLEELERRDELTPEAKLEERDALVLLALVDGDLELARELIEARSGAMTYRHALNLLIFDGIERAGAQRQASEAAEATSREGEPRAPAERGDADARARADAPDPLLTLDLLAVEALDSQGQLAMLADALGLAGLCGLSVIAARAGAAIPGKDLADLDTLEGILLDEREKLDLRGEDPALWLWELPRSQKRRKRPAEQQLEEVREKLKEREAELLRVRAEVDRLRSELSRRELSERAAGASVPVPLDEAELRRVRRKVEELSAELRARQQESQELRQRLREREEGAAGEAVRTDAAPPHATDEEAGLLPPGAGEEAQLHPVLFEPEFSETARSIDDDRIVLRAQEMAVRFAALDPAAWKQAKKMQDLDDVYTVRIGIHHRLFLVRQGGRVRARELVTRESFDRTLKRYRR